MTGGALALAEQLRQRDFEPELIVTTDMLDVAAFRGLYRPHCPMAVYFHENQLTYPDTPGDPRAGERHYAYKNFTSACAADAVWFNSQYHREAFLGALPEFLAAFPDTTGVEWIPRIAAKSSILPIGLDLQALDTHRVPRAAHSDRPPLLLWNHRWEYDKDPETFFEALFKLQEDGIAFELAVLGMPQQRRPMAIFEAARQRLAAHIVQWGRVESRAEYARWLWQADLLPVTSRQDFFGISVVEAIYCHTYPLLPRRLVFPEHLPLSLADEYLYDIDGATSACDNLYKALLCQLGSVAAPDPELRALVSQYDWAHQVTVYDDLALDLATA